MASAKVVEITRPHLANLKTALEAYITNVKHLSSYNWLEAPKATPTIAIPGLPPLWSPPTAPRQLKQDRGHIYIAQNTARHRESPMEPLFRAVYTTLPSFDVQSIDIVSDRNNIRKLLSFIDPRSAKKGLEAFTINVEVVKGTAIFQREEMQAETFIGRNDFAGFGHSFEEAYTVNQIRRSTGHHRIVSYSLGGMNFVIRHETDGYVGNESLADGLSEIMRILSLATPDNSTEVVPADSKLTIKKLGQPVPMVSTIEIKTRTRKRRLPMSEVAPQLWVSQTPKLVRAYHDSGLFGVPEVEDVMAEVKKWEQTNQKSLRALVALIAEIKLAATEFGRAVVKYEAVGDKLVIRPVQGKRLLPMDLYLKWGEDVMETTEETGQYDEAMEVEKAGVKDEANEKMGEKKKNRRRGQRKNKAKAKDGMAAAGGQMTSPLPG